MIDSIDAIAEFINGRSRETFESDRMAIFAIVRAIEVLGEAASKVTPETRALAPSVPWKSITGMRNRLIHGYFDIDPEIVWQTASAEAPALKPALESLFVEESPERRGI